MTMGTDAILFAAFTHEAKDAVQPKFTHPKPTAILEPPQLPLPRAADAEAPIQSHIVIDAFPARLRKLALSGHPTSPYNRDGFALCVLLTPDESRLLARFSPHFLAARLLSGDTQDALTTARRQSDRIPSRYFLDEGALRYSDLYLEIDRIEADRHIKRLIVSNLDRGFIEYCKRSFIHAGLTREQAGRLCRVFCDAFRKSVTAGVGIKRSYLGALRALRDRYPSLIDGIPYSQALTDLPA